MTTLTQGPRNADFIHSVLDPEFSYEKAEVLLGQDLDAGEVVRLNSDGRLIAWSNENFTDGTEDQIVGILVNATDATAGHTMASYVARGAVVNLAQLTYPAAGEVEMIAQLKALNIICR